MMFYLQHLGLNNTIDTKKKDNAYNKGFVVCKKEGCKHVKVGQCAILVFREKITIK
jgi:hypothetical protein